VLLMLLLLREDLAAKGFRHGAQRTSCVRRSQCSVLSRQLGCGSTVVAIRGGSSSDIGLQVSEKRGEGEIVG